MLGIARDSLRRIGIARFRALVCVLGAAASASGQVPSLPRGESSGEPVRADRSEVQQGPPSRGVTVYRGRALSYEVVDGLAVHGGDMVLGTAEEAAARRPGSAKPLPRDWLARRDLAAIDPGDRWPYGRIPYVIGRFSAEQVQAIREAIDEWNTRTLIQLVPRTAEADYVEFAGGPLSLCSADLGRKGGAQRIYLPASGCSKEFLVHEIGHTVGLRHEHQRVDRDRYVIVPNEALNGSAGDWYAAVHPAIGRYNYASVMHYRHDVISAGGLAAMETIPPGMPIPYTEGGLSAGDIDGVARLYGRPSRATTISTNPPGLEILVNGRRFTTPARFFWSPGTRHVVEAPSPQIEGQRRFLFGRWNDGGDRRHTVTADPDATWLEANFIVQRQLTARANPPHAGSVEIRPASPDGFHTLRTPIELTAVPAPGSSYRLRQWGWGDGVISRHGRSSNPASAYVDPAEAGRPGRIEYAAAFTREPVFLIDTTVDWIEILVNQRRALIPFAILAADYADGVTVEAKEVFQHGNVRYRFRGWSDGGARVHEARVPEAGGVLTLNVVPEYQLSADDRGQGTTATSPVVEDGFYPAEAEVVVTATPAREDHFVAWTGDLAGAEPVQVVAMDGPKRLGAAFAGMSSGEARAVTLPAASDRFRAHFPAQGATVFVPPDATELAVRFRAAPGPAEVKLYVRRGIAPEWGYESDGGTPYVVADAESTEPGPDASVRVARESDPPLTAGIYFIGLAARAPAPEVRGTLLAEVRRAEIARAHPRAFTFVAPRGYDPEPQAMRLTYEAAEGARYRIDSNRDWLFAAPREWTATGSGTTEIAVSVSGAALPPDTHQGELTIARVAERGSPVDGSRAGTRIPVAFAVTPPDRTD